MANQIFKESDLVFSFDHNWLVKKYDNHAYFKVLSGYGLKGVDFIGLYKLEKLYLIEVKNFRKRAYSPLAPDWSDLKGTKPPIVEVFRTKIQDSLKLIRIVNTYMKRKWWYFFLMPIHNFFDPDNLNKDWKFWSKVHELTHDSSNVIPVLWIELDDRFLASERTTGNVYLKKLEKQLQDIEDHQLEQIVIVSKEVKSEKLKGLDVKFLRLQ